MTDRLFNLIKKITPSRWHWILQHEGHKRYFANISWMFFGQMFSLLVAFFVGTWIARYLGPENYGIFNYAVAFTGLFSFLAYLGVDGILNRELVNYPENKDKLMGTSFILKLFGGCLGFILIFISAFLFNSNPLIRLLIILLGISSFFQASFVISVFFQSQVKAKENFKAQMISTLISTFLKIILILMGKGVIWLVLIYAFDSLWQGIFFFYFYKKQGYRIFAWNFDLNLAKKIWHDSWPLMLSSAAAFVYLKIDQVMIGKMMGEAAVGIYAASVKITEIFYFIPGIICVSLFPAIINAKKTDDYIYKKRLKSFYYFLGILGLLLSIIVVILSKPIINLLFGIKYIESIYILRVYIWSSIGLFLGSGITYHLMAENKTKLIFKINLLAMIINIVLNLILIPIYGLVGATIATLVAYSVAPIWMIFNKNKKIK